MIAYKQRNALCFLTLLGVTLLSFSETVAGHPMDERNAAFVQSIDGVAFWPFLYLGAKHMVTGYDHLLFLVGVIFYLYKLSDVVLYVSLFTLGHSVTLLFGVLGGINVNAYVIDAIIGLSVAYKAFENMGLSSTQSIATLFDGIARHSPEGIRFKQRAEEVGFKQAVTERDSGNPIPGSRN